MMIRVGQAAELEDLQGLLRACIDGMRQAGLDQWDEVYPTAQIIADDLRGGTLIVVERERQLVGAVTLDQKQEPEYDSVTWTFSQGSHGVVHRLMIAPSLQRQGFGRTLMAAAEDRARGAGWKALRLDAFSLNIPALRLYRELGYAEVGSVHFRKGLFVCFEKSLVDR